MSSLNPVFLLPEAMATRGEAIAQGLFGSFTLGVGQFCTKPGLVFALRGAGHGQVRGDADEAGRGRRRPAPCSPRTSASPSRSTAARCWVSMAWRSWRLPMWLPGSDPGAAQRRTHRMAQHFLEHPELATEAFGPFSLVIVVDDLDQMAACARAAGRSAHGHTARHRCRSDGGGCAGARPPRTVPGDSSSTASRPASKSLRR